MTDQSHPTNLFINFPNKKCKNSHNPAIITNFALIY